MLYEPRSSGISILDETILRPKPKTASCFLKASPLTFSLTAPLLPGSPQPLPYFILPSASKWYSNLFQRKTKQIKWIPQHRKTWYLFWESRLFKNWLYLHVPADPGSSTPLSIPRSGFHSPHGNCSQLRWHPYNNSNNSKGTSLELILLDHLVKLVLPLAFSHHIPQLFLITLAASAQSTVWLLLRILYLAG